MGETIIIIVGALLAITLQLLLMRFLWRRMRAVKAQTAARTDDLPQQQPWHESMDGYGDHRFQRSFTVNDDLIDQGAAARETRWPVDRI
jgi:hypothetical protein